MPRSKCGRFGEGKNLLFFPGVEPPFFECAARSPATKPPTVRILHTNRTRDSHLRPYVEKAYTGQLLYLFPAS
jgi:hypothetical protein